jgi:hypothetical protein
MMTATYENPADLRQAETRSCAPEDGRSKLDARSWKR